MKRLTQEEFINKCRSILGDAYTYEKTKYVNNRTKIIITNKYGEDIECFPSNINKLKNKKDRYTTEAFIRRAKEIYGDKYTYDKVNCSNSHDKVTITCPLHGDFQKLAHAFLNGQECPICGNRYSNEKFYNAAKKIHGDKYDYSKVNYINNSTKVTIICAKHGEFLQTPNSHLRGSGCPLCYRERVKKIGSLKFFEKCKKLYEEKYDYSQTKYSTSNGKISVICQEHGKFWKTAVKHSIGQGCPICSKINQSEKLKLTTADFIDMAVKKHGNRYDYSKVEYNGWENKVTIICKKHGQFLQTPHSHINGSGCPKCHESHAEREIEEYLNSKNIEYEVQKTFKWLKMKKNLFLDFYLPTFNVGIEFQGGQHFIPVQYGNTQKNASLILEITKKRDKEKNRLCKENGLEILYIVPSKYGRQLNGFYKNAKIFDNIADAISYISGSL